jgi:hypothetical protein
MAEQKKGRKRRPPRKPQYKSYPRATSVTVYSPDGSPVSDDVLGQIELYIASVALENRLLTAVNRG